jgi:hypothetical protein
MRRLTRPTTRYANCIYLTCLIRFQGYIDIQSNNFKSIAATFALQPKPILFCDLDNTLIMGLGYRPKNPQMRISGYGSDIWFSAQEKRIKESPNYSPELFMMLLAEYHAIVPHLTQTTTEACVPEQLSRLKAMGIPIFGLTARAPCLAEATHHELNKLGIEFSKGKTMDGIIFCDGQSKSKRMEDFSQTEFGRQAFFGKQSVLFVDDKESHCAAMKKFLHEKNMNGIIAHYTRVERLLPVASHEQIEQDRAQLMRDHGLNHPRI